MRGALRLLSAFAFAGCVAEFDDETTLVREERILAVRGVPAEAPPGTPVHYEALVAGPGAASGRVPEFSYCTKARSADERTGVSQTCLEGGNLQGIPADATMPADACARFGPNTPPAEGGEPVRRPSDPDPTGGYHIPVLASIAEDRGTRTFGAHRIRCDLAGATRDIFEAFQERYRNNRHPDIANILMSSAESGEVVIEVEVPAGSFEDYVVYSARDSALFDATEVLTAHWFVNAGSLDASRSTIDRGSRTAAVRWVGDDGTESPRLWLIIRDSRGGSVWGEYPIVSETAMAPQ